MESTFSVFTCWPLKFAMPGISLVVLTLHYLIQFLNSSSGIAAYKVGEVYASEVPDVVDVMR